MKRGGGVARVGARYGQRYGRPRRKVVGFGEIEGREEVAKGRRGGRAVQHTGCCTQLDNNKLKKEQRALF